MNKIVTETDYWLFQLAITHPWICTHSNPQINDTEDDVDYKHFWVWDETDMSAGGDSVLEMLWEMEEHIGALDPILHPLIQLAKALD